MKTVIIPTLNEEENIGNLIRLIIQNLGSDDVRVIVVDDNSKDGTHTVVRALQSEYKGVSLLIRTKERGLSSAIRHGAKHVTEGSVVVMDADLSHHPRYLPMIFEKLDAGYDVVVGSRHTEGGAIVGWSGDRIAMSLIATRLVAMLFRVNTTDPMSGLMGCKSAQLLATGFQSHGFKFLLELLVRNPNLRVTDVPIVFQDRVHGSSKLGSQTIMQFLALVFRLLFARKPKHDGLRRQANVRN
ncbi:MAG: polyprenol monophosphomannose synthase [Candidatus Thorarchaeota archaeon]|nr:polyprenol monophosphomannose synthase [Candidatus Thorarchaeota archaeon]